MKNQHDNLSVSVVNAPLPKPFNQTVSFLAYIVRQASVSLVSNEFDRMSDIVVPSRVKYVIGPDGSPLTIADLPPPSTRRWVIKRKAQVVSAVRGGLLSLDEARERYCLTMEEYLSWQHSIDQHGLAGLRTTRIQHYRH